MEIIRLPSDQETSDRLEAKAEEYRGRVFELRKRLEKKYAIPPNLAKMMAFNSDAAYKLGLIRELFKNGEVDTEEFLRKIERENKERGNEAEELLRDEVFNNACGVIYRYCSDIGFLREHSDVDFAKEHSYT